jgi:hypothetical protein
MNKYTGTNWGIIAGTIQEAFLHIAGNKREYRDTMYQLSNYTTLAEGLDHVVKDTIYDVI